MLTGKRFAIVIHGLGGPNYPGSVTLPHCTPGTALKIGALHCTPVVKLLLSCSVHRLQCNVENTLSERVPYTGLSPLSKKVLCNEHKGICILTVLWRVGEGTFQSISGLNSDNRISYRCDSVTKLLQFTKQYIRIIGFTFTIVKTSICQPIR